MSNLSSLIRPNVGRAFLWTALMALSVAPGQIRGSAVSVTACAQNSNNIFLTCTSNTDGSLLSATTSASGINGNPFVNTSTASAAGEVVSFGELGVFASTSWNNPHNASLGDSAYTYAIVSDVLHFAGLSSGTISFTYQLDGSSTQSLDGQGFSQYWLLPCAHKRLATDFGAKATALHRPALRWQRRSRAACWLIASNWKRS